MKSWLPFGREVKIGKGGKKEMVELLAPDLYPFTFTSISEDVPVFRADTIFCWHTETHAIKIIEV